MEMKTCYMSNQHEDFAFSERSSQNGINGPFEDKDAKSATSQLKELPVEFVGRGEVRGFEFRQIMKSDKGYIYEVRQLELKPYYEVFRRIENHRFGCISYPGSSSFGITIWTAKTMADALERFKNL